jgi:hypothetical protein
VWPVVIKRRQERDINFEGEIVHDLEMNFRLANFAAFIAHIPLLGCSKDAGVGLAGFLVLLPPACR